MADIITDLGGDRYRLAVPASGPYPQPSTLIFNLSGTTNSVMRGWFYRFMEVLGQSALTNPNNAIILGHLRINLAGKDLRFTDSVNIFNNLQATSNPTGGPAPDNIDGAWGQASGTIWVNPVFPGASMNRSPTLLLGTWVHEVLHVAGFKGSLAHNQKGLEPMELMSQAMRMLLATFRCLYTSLT